MRRGFHVAQQGVHFVNVQTPPGAHRRVAGQRAGKLFKMLFHGQPLSQRINFLGHVFQKTRYIALIHKRGHFAHHYGGLGFLLRAETLNRKAQFGQFGRARY